MLVERETTSPPDVRLGNTIARRYVIESLLGRGGMSTVYAARDLQLGRRVALKLFRAELAAGEDMRRHRDEVEVLATLNHPALVTLYDAVEDDNGAAVLVLELVDGDPLDGAIASGALSDTETALIGAAIADALAYTHERGIMHRDVKPGNIIVPHLSPGHTGPRAKLVDFGIARLVDESRLTGTGSVLGTAHYLSPEQALGVGVGTPSDIYSLGLVLLEALTGQRAFEGTGIAAAAARLSRDPAVPADLSTGWAELITRMTARTAADRPAASEVSMRLRELAAEDATRVMTALSHPTEGDATQVFDPLEAPPATDASTSAMTEVLAPEHPDSAHDEASSGTARSRRLAARAAAAPGSRLPRRVFIAAGVIMGALVLFVVGFLGTTAVTQFIAETSTVTPVEAPTYAPVDGELGEQLERLQRSVAP